MSKLFDGQEEIDDELPVVPDEEDEISVRVPKRDKIFNNDYNTGNLDFEEYDMPKVDTVYAESNLNDCYDSFEYQRHHNLEVFVDQYFKNTEFGKILGMKKKIPKQLLPRIYITIREQFKPGEYTFAEIFSAIAEYFGLNYEVLYENIPAVYREELVRELDDKHGILKRKGLKRLF